MNPANGVGGVTAGCYEIHNEQRSGSPLISDETVEKNH